MASLNKDLVFLILQFLNEEKYEETAHRLEQDSGFFFNMNYFEDEVLNGNWDEVEHYLSGFTKVDDNKYSTKIFFEIRKQKYLEALDKHDHAKATAILVNDLKVFESVDKEVFKEITLLLTLENFRQHKELLEYKDTQSGRAIMLIELKKIIEENPLLQKKLQFPNLEPSRLKALINQSLHWQHGLCKNHKPNPDIKTLFVDHSCGQPTNTRASSQGNNPMLGPIQKAGDFRTMPAPSFPPFLFAFAPVPTCLVGNSQVRSHPTVPTGAIGLGAPTNSGTILVPSKTATPTIFPTYFPSSSESRTTQAVGLPDVNQPATISHVTYAQNYGQVMHTPNDLPITVARILSQGSTPVSMDFHPIQHTILLVGTSVGDVGLWDIGSREKLVLKHFKVWKVRACSMSFQSALIKDPVVSVNRIIWSPDGSLFGVAHSLHIVQIYSYHGGCDIRQHLEIDAHIGGVNDLAFACPNKKLCLITCGEDKTIKVWDAHTGTKQFTFEGHKASVYSICPHNKEDFQFVFSTGLDGKIKAWFYDNQGPIFDYDAPGHWCTTMAYCADGSRLFSCGTSKDGISYVAEWNDSEGTIKRTYLGFNKRSLGVVQFDTTRNRFLAVGDEFLIKFWDMDNPQLLTTIQADGDLPASPRIRFNKEGSLLAVSTNDNAIKILANDDGVRRLRTFDNNSSGNLRTPPETMVKRNLSPFIVAAGATSSGITERATPAIAISGMNDDSRNSLDVKPILPEESIEKTKISKYSEIAKSAQCRSLRLFDNLRTSKISRLVYNNSGVAILALASDAVHVLWTRQCNHHIPTGKATADITQQLWLPQSGTLMKNETTDANPEEIVPCIALSKNGSYVMSASSGKISLFNMINFEMMTTFKPPPPAATFVAFHPRDNNIVIIGMDDSTIHIYNLRLNELITILRGHSGRITGLAFSLVLNVLVSSGADAQICVWASDEWGERIRKSLENLSGQPTSLDICVQFHQDQIHFLAFHEEQIAIYDANSLECLLQWVPREALPRISHATFSSDGRLIYVSFVDASVCVFSSTDLRIQCRINPAAYLPANISSNVYPFVVAAHPLDPNQFALGLTDGAIHILEPPETEEKWGVPTVADNVSTSRASSAPPGGANCDK